MSELNPQEPVPAKTGEPKKKKKGAPTWVWFIGTFAIVSVLGNVIFGGNTWINSSITFVNNTVASLQVEKDTSKDAFCLTGSLSATDLENALTVVNEADALVGNTTGAISYASKTEVEEEKIKAIGSIQESAKMYEEVGQRLLTAKNCDDETFAFLMADFGDTMIAMSDNFEQWSLEAISEDPDLLSSVPTLIETAIVKAQALIKYLGTLE
jgi:hypothetical protein